MSYYFVSIGGSGARVLEALTHIATAGLLPNEKGGDSLYVTFVDPDTGNGNLARTDQLLTNVATFTGVDVRSDTPLFKTPPEVNDSVWSITGLNSTLDAVASWQKNKEEPVGKLYESLYTKKERAELLNVGFRGRPSIGAAVLGINAASDGGAWATFINKVASDLGSGKEAMVFLAGSIFGGTGAAGIPTIAKLLKDGFAQYGTNLRVGAILLLPYFTFSPTATQKATCGLYASAENFLTNTKAALHYYADNGAELFDSMYFVGDDNMRKTGNFSVGAGTQENDAHIIDLYGAFAAAHFYRGEKGKHCYSISKNEENKISWQDLPISEVETKRFVQYVRFIFAYLALVKPELNKDSGNPPWYKDYWKNRIDKKAPEVLHFDQYCEKFMRWLSQTQTYSRSVNLINPESFKVTEKGAIIEDKFFHKLDFVERDVEKYRIDAVRTYLNSHGSDDVKGDGGFMGFGAGKRTPAGTKQEFGLFLRRLYDACEI